MKKIKLFILILIISAIFSTTCFADNANVYSVSNCDVVVAFVQGHDGSIESFTDDYYDYGGFSEDGIILLVDTISGEGHISTSGKCIETIDIYKIYEIENSIIPYLQQDDLDGAERQFVICCKSYLYSGIRQQIYKVIASLGIGTAIAGVPLSRKKKELKSVQKKSAASNYIKSGSIALTDRSDIFIRSAVTRVPIPKTDNRGPSGPGGGHSGGSIHVGSSGASHGGHSFKY